MRTVRSECLDYLLVLNEGHLERILRSHAHRYNGNQGLSQQIPAPERTAPLTVESTSDAVDGVSDPVQGGYIDTTGLVG